MELNNDLTPPDYWHMGAYKNIHDILLSGSTWVN